MNRFVYTIIATWFLCLPFMVYAHEFVVAKKSKPKKESVSAVKEDIVGLLEFSLRQLGANIQQAVGVQNQLLDMMHKVMEDDTLSIPALQECRANLERQLAILEKQQQELLSYRA